jgi:hypothetical protein
MSTLSRTVGPALAQMASRLLVWLQGRILILLTLENTLDQAVTVTKETCQCSLSTQAEKLLSPLLCLISRSPTSKGTQ